MTKTIFKDRKCYKEFMVFKMLKSIFSWFLTDLYLFFISFFYILISAVWQGVISNVTVSSQQLITSISDLHPAYVYEVRVLANNSIGYGNASQSLIIKLDEEQPSGPPTEVKVKAIGSESLRISWMVSFVFAQTLQEAIVIRYFDL